MTIQHVINQIIIHLCEKDTFTLDDAAEIDVEKDLEDKQFDLVLVALTELENTGLITFVGGSSSTDKDGKPSDDEPVWILTKPMQGVGTDVGLSIQTCILIKDVLEGYAKANGMPYELVNPFQIHEGHIRHLIQIVGDVLDKDEPPHTP